MLNWKSIAKAISIIGNSKAIIDILQLWIRSCENAVLNSQFPLLLYFTALQHIQNIYILKKNLSL